MSGKIVAERGGTSMGGSALIHTTIQLEDGTEVTVGTSYHDDIPQGNSTIVFEGRDSFVLMFSEPIYFTETPAHAENVVKVLAAGSLEELTAAYGPLQLPTDFSPKTEAEAQAPEDFGLDAILDELAKILGVPVTELTGENETAEVQD